MRAKKNYEKDIIHYTKEATMEIKTILWPTDLSENSLKAGNHVISLSEKYQAEVVLLYVSVDLCSFFPAYGNYPSVEHLNNFRDWELEKPEKDWKESVRRN